mmetsp:Transcript_66643/g.171547  ORF Transcript_66643/g.171547 Transcript_66643/m.171547 type:complete len:297 (+) Transcript_66643:106-996(+)
MASAVEMTTGAAEARAGRVVSNLGAFLRANPLAVPLAAGAVAGTVVEAALFPLDTVKTRLQAGVGSLGSLCAARGARSVYSGVGLSSAGSIPASALFFGTYEYSKDHCGNVMLASVLGEVVACGVRVPVDLMKQRMQTGLVLTAREALRELRATRVSTLSMSFRILVVRDATHSGMQYPMYESLKSAAAKHRGLRHSEDLSVSDSAVCGCAAGVTSATITTPLDVLKTRTNLGRSHASPGKTSIALEARRLCTTHGIGALFAGASCRAAWMGLGGFVFLGSFELAKCGLVAMIHMG